MTARTSRRLNLHDLLTWPGLGRFLKWRHARTALQLPLLLIAGLMIFDGLVGPQLAPKNLVTVGAWLHYRGWVVLTLLVFGNLFCMACPFMLPRQAARWMRERGLAGGRLFPAFLRNKWLALGLLLIFLYCYERFSLWGSPWLTAWIAIGYFVAAFGMDIFFRGAAFCKYVCPLGHFNFLGSLISPLEIKTRDARACQACRSKDCIRGHMAAPLHGPNMEPVAAPTGPVAPSRPTASNDGRPTVRGCELWLFQERKVGNMDCTFCLDCIHACPYDNVGLITRLPTSELWTDPFRSGIGRLSRRPDLVALTAVFVFGSFLNAFAMIPPVYALRAVLEQRLGITSPAAGLALIFFAGLVVLPAIALTVTGLLGRALAGQHSQPLRSVLGRYVFALAPLGFGMWLAHYSFHLLTGGLTIVPVIQSFLADIGLYPGPVQWGLGALVPAEWLFPIEAVFMYAGAFGSLIAAFQIARDQVGMADGGRGAVLAAAAPWMALCLTLLALGLWILVQPMEMRGTFLFSLPGG